MLIGYARTSTEDQVAGLEAQIRDLTISRCDIIFHEHVSSVGDRPEFEKALTEAKAGDTLVVTRIDRLARSILGLLQLVEDLNRRNVALRILNLGGDVVDTRSATGRLMLSMLASFAQFEREMMLERQAEGIAKARAEGKYKGKPPMDPTLKAKIFEMRAAKIPRTHIAKELGLCRRTVERVVIAARAS